MRPPNIDVYVSPLIIHFVSGHEPSLPPSESCLSSYQSNNDDPPTVERPTSSPVPPWTRSSNGISEFLISCSAVVTVSGRVEDVDSRPVLSFCRLPPKHLLTAGLWFSSPKQLSDFM